MKNIVVIGGGFGGLSAAVLLQHQGYQVTLLDNNSTWGGRARLWEAQGFSFDMGPSWYLMPEVFDQFFEALGRRREDYYALDKLSTYYKVFFENQDPVTITQDLQRTRDLFESFEPGAGKTLSTYLDKAKFKYDTAMAEFLYKDYRSIFDFFNKKILTEGLKLNLFQSLDSFVGKFFKDHRAKKILEYAMVFLGNSPKNAPALYSIMSYVDLALGVYFPKGGLHGVAEGLVKLARELGVDCRLNTPVEKILTQKGRVTGVQTAGGIIPAEVVVSSADYAHTELELLEPRDRSFSERYWKKKVWAPSMFIAFIGVGKKLPQLEHHNLYFSRDWDRHFDKIFKTPDWPDNPCFYLSAISRTDEAMAPAGGENLFLLIPVATGLTETEEGRQAYLQKVLDHVEGVTGVTFQKDILVRRIFSVTDFQKDYHAWGGTALGLAHTLFQTAVFRPGHRSKKVKGLYYTGQYTHPGVGVPMTLIASQITADLIKKDGAP